VKLDNCIDKKKVTYIGGAVPLGAAPPWVVHPLSNPNGLATPLYR
jgi:hypothetical protein